MEMSLEDGKWKLEKAGL